MPRAHLAIALVALLSLFAVPVTAVEEAPASDTGSEATTATDPFVRCRDSRPLLADPDLYGDEPIYVSNEQPTDKIAKWAKSKPGYAGLWIDRDHLGWVTVAFTQDLEKRQRQLRRKFPDAGVVAVQASRTEKELRQLQRRLDKDLGEVTEGWSTGQAVSDNLVHVGVAVLTPDIVDFLAQRYAGEPLCVDGADLADLPAPGPQPLGGDGWNLLGTFQGPGPSHQTGIAADGDAYEALWARSGIPGDAPSVDFTESVTVWFALGHGSSCPNLRLDDVHVDADRALVYPFIVMPDHPMMCTDDLVGAYQYVVALDRERLPKGPFVIRNSGEERRRGGSDATAVAVDLSEPGSTAAASDIIAEASQPRSEALRSGDFTEPIGSSAYLLDARCGIGYLGRINDVDWVTAKSDIPAKWSSSTDEDGNVLLTIRLRTKPEPKVKASAGGRTIVYRPSADGAPTCAS